MSTFLALYKVFCKNLVKFKKFLRSNRYSKVGCIKKEVDMNQLLEAVITNKDARNTEALPVVAAQSAGEYLPWSSEIN